MSTPDAHSDLPVAILAGGLATRLWPLTEKIPKILLGVAGRPFLEHQVEYLRQQGVRRIVLCVGFLGDMIRERYGTGAALGVDLHYSYDGPVLLGTGGAIRQALPALGQSFFVLYGDSYLMIDYADVADRFLTSGKPALMTVFRNDDHWDTSNVWFEDGRIRKYDKQDRVPAMRHIDYGLSVFSASVFEAFPPGTVLDLAEIQRDLASRGDLAGYEAKTRVDEIGSQSGLQELNSLLTSGRLAHSV